MKAYVNDIIEKPVRGGTMIMHDILFSNGDRVGAGKFKPKGIKKGDYVEYEVTMNGNFKNLTPGSLSKIDPPPGESAPAPQAAASYSSGSSYDARQDVISRQAALNSALSFVSMLAAAGALPLPKSKATQADALEAIVMEYTGRFFHQNTGNKYKVHETAKGGTVEEDLAAMEEADGAWDE